MRYNDAFFMMGIEPLRDPLRPILRGFNTNFLNSFGIVNLFLNGEQGVWYDPSDLSTLFQDSAGTTPVTAVEQPVGLMLDKSKGLVLGSELVTNANLASAWTVAGANTVTQDGSAVRVNYVDNNAGALVFLASGPLSSNLSAGKRYRVTFEAKAEAGTAVNIVANDGVTSTAFSLTNSYQSFTAYLLYSTGTPYVGRVNDGSLGPGEAYSVRNISVRELPGNHAFQSTAASRPVLSARVNLLTKTEQFDDAAWTKTRSSISANTTAAPNGLVTADKLIEDTTASNTHSVSGPIITLPSASTATVTVYVKAAERVWCRVANAGVVSGGAFVNLATGQFGTIEAGVTASSIQDVGNGWYRVSITGVLAGTASQLLVQLSTGNGSASYTGDGTSGIFIWGADLRVTNTGTNLPEYQRVNTATDYNTTGFPLYLAFDGVDDGMVTNSIDFTATDKMTVVAGVRKLSDAATGMLVELSASLNSNNGAFYLACPVSAAPNVEYRSKGTIAAAFTDSPFAAPISLVITGASDIAADQLIIRNNGVQKSSSGDQGLGNYGNFPLYIGRRNGTTLPFNGRLYGLIVRGAATPAAKLTQVESYINNKTKAY